MALFFALAFALSWTPWAMAGWWMTDPVREVAIVAGRFGPAVAALVVIGRVGGAAALAEALRRHVRLRGAWKALALAAVLPVVLASTGLALHRLLGGSAVPGPLYPVPMLPVVVLYVLVLGGPLGEELGWRGFALPRLERRARPLAATVALWIVWAVWHLPLFLLEDSVQALVPFWLWLTQLLVVSVLLTWFARRTPWSLAPVLALHTSSNVTVGMCFIAPPGQPALLPMTLTVAVGAVVAALMVTTPTFRGHTATGAPGIRDHPARRPAP